MINSVVSAVLPKNFLKQRNLAQSKNDQLDFDYDLFFKKTQDELIKAINKERSINGVKNVINQSSLYNLNQLSEENNKCK